jgi:nitroreductase
MTQTALLEALNWRYATKAFDPEKVIPADLWSTLEQSLVLTPSSFGLQPWKFLIVQDKELREKLVPHAWNQRQVADCSHLVIFLVKKAMSDADIDAFLERQIAVRGGNMEALAAYRGMMVGFRANAEKEGWLGNWAKLQSYIALGQLMTSAAVLGVDACPMEGFVAPKFDEILGLEGSGYTTAVLCPLGYRSADDKYASLPKVRFEAKDVVEYR